MFSYAFRIRDGSGSADPYQWTTDPDTALFFGVFQDAYGSVDPYQWTTDPDTALFCNDFQDAYKKLSFVLSFFAFL